MKTHLTPWKLLAFAALSALGLAACGGSDDADDTLLMPPEGEACALVNFQQGNKTLHKPPQWFIAQITEKDRLQLITNPQALPNGLPPGHACAFKFTVKPGDRPVGGSERAEVSQSDVGDYRLGEGVELYYRWSTMFDPVTLPSEASQRAKIQYLNFVQWHHSDWQLEGAPPIDFVVRKEPGNTSGYIIALVVRGNPSHADALWTWPVQAGEWHEFVFHLRLSARNGLVELWHNGEHRRQDNIKNLFSENPYVYVKQGLHRNNMNLTSIVYHSPMLVGTSPEQVGLGPDGPLPLPGHTNVFLPVGNSPR
jgi:hypothetical protein